MYLISPHYSICRDFTILLWYTLQYLTPIFAWICNPRAFPQAINLLLQTSTKYEVLKYYLSCRRILELFYSYCWIVAIWSQNILWRFTIFFTSEKTAKISVLVIIFKLYSATCPFIKPFQSRWRILKPLATTLWSICNRIHGINSKNNRWFYKTDKNITKRNSLTYALAFLFSLEKFY